MIQKRIQKRSHKGMKSLWNNMPKNYTQSMPKKTTKREGLQDRAFTK